jgi:hypothetical protein
VSHPIPLHTAGKLERALEASSRFVAARGAKGWVMRIVAYFACQYCEAVIGLLEGLLAEYRAGTLVLPGLLDDSSTVTAASETAERPARPRSRGPAARRMRAPRGAPASDPRDAPAVARQQSAAGAPIRPRLTLSPLHLELRRPEHGSLGLAGHPSHVPRWPAPAFGGLQALPTHVIFVTFSI